jgi:hypothetical protein
MVTAAALALSTAADAHTLGLRCKKITVNKSCTGRLHRTARSLEMWIFC